MCFILLFILYISKYRVEPRELPEVLIDLSEGISSEVSPLEPIDCSPDLCLATMATLRCYSPYHMSRSSIADSEIIVEWTSNWTVVLEHTVGGIQIHLHDLCELLDHREELVGLGL